MQRYLQVIVYRLSVLLLCAFLGVGQACAGSQLLLGVGGPAAGGGGGASCSFAGTAFDDSVSTTKTFSINIGTAAANRLVVVGWGMQNVNAPATLTVNGVTLNQDSTQGSTQGAGVWSAIVASGSGAQNVVLTGAGAFAETAISVWTCTGLSSNVVKHIGGNNGGSNAPFTINVSAGDFMFVATQGGTTNSTFTSSTEVPTAVRNADTNVPPVTGAEWITVISTNAAFSIAPTAGGNAVGAAATYH